MNPMVLMLVGLGVGASLMYLTDPQTGNRRRAVIRDKVRHGIRKAGDAADVAVRDLGNRARGLAAETQSHFSGQEVADHVLAERVRAELGRVCSHPGSVDVVVRNGRGTLTGIILSHEAGRVRARVASVPGVRNVDDRLDIREEAGGLPALQGGAPRRVRYGWRQTKWSPTVRLLSGVAGTGLALHGAARRDLVGLVTGLSGAGLLARGATNLDLGSLLGLGRRRPAVTVRKSLNVQAPPAQVYEFWNAIERFPSFMANIREVQDLGGGRSRWTVAGVAGAPVEWEAVVTQRVPNRELAWETVPGSTVEHSGRVLFLPNASGGTRIDVHLSYAPPGGAIGHSIAWLFGTDPKAEINADLARMKTLLEHQDTPKSEGDGPRMEPGSGGVPSAEQRDAG
jgi:uncharacterized membrane protein